MNDPAQGGFTLEVCESLSEVDETAWSALAGTSRGSLSAACNPFSSLAFLSSLEESGCVGQGTGWLPRHLLLKAPDGRLAGAVAAYAKTHSQGEYVFDHGWADAFERAGGRYYPKLQVAFPFTPAAGPRLLVAGGFEAGAVKAALADGLKSLAMQAGMSSVHATFLQDADRDALLGAGFLHRTDQQFHFFNRGYRDHGDFLDRLASRKRKALRKEREAALSNGITIEWLTGGDLTEAVWDEFFAFYMDTGSRKWGRPYLNRRFYSLIGERMADDILLVMARRNGRRIAGAINFIGSDTLYGRHWGCVEDHPFLHFEVCYHQAIDFAIARGLSTVEAGAQGEHKLARGYEPVTTHSAHWIAHPGLRDAVADYLQHERLEISRASTILSAHTPFRKDSESNEEKTD